MVVGHYSPHLGVVVNGIITLIFWFSYFRYLYFLIYFPKFPQVVILGRHSHGKAVSKEGSRRIYTDCFDASFGFLLLNLSGRVSKALLRSRIRNRKQIEVYQSGSVYIYQKGKFHLLLLIFPLVTSYLLFLDIMEVWG